MAPAIYKLPSEIISVIFECGKDIDDEMALTPSDEGYQAMSFEVLVSHICSHFRQISLATPTLWTSICVHGHSQLDHIIQRLARSRACGLDIRIELSVQDPEIDDAKLEVIMENIFYHSLRWRSLFIRYNQERQSDPITTGLHFAPVPRLQCLSITIDDVMDEVDPTIVNQSINLPHIFIAGAPRLAFVRLRGLAMQFFRPPLNNVATLHLDQVRYLPIECATFREILSCSPFLTNLSIYGSILRPGNWPTQNNAIYIPTLRSLRVCGERGETYSGVMEGINAPILESLTLKSLQEHDLDSLWSMVDQNLRFRSLKFLNFTSFGLSGLTYKRIFRTFQNITSFSILSVDLGAIPIMEVLSEGAIENDNGRPFIPWPELKTLRFGADVLDIDENLVNTLIEVRERCGFPISTFVIVVGAQGEEDYLPLELNTWQNLEINFSSGVLAWPEDCTHLDYEDTLF